MFDGFTKFRSKQVFTTGQVGKILSVAPRTAAKWCDSGKLKHYRIPGGTDRRVTRDALIEFIFENGMEGLRSVQMTLTSLELQRGTPEPLVRP